MSRIHDAGGMQGMGEIEYSASEKMFHETWEARVQAMAMATAVFRKGPLREAIETIPAKDFMQMSYYERWLQGLTSWMIGAGLISAEEVATGRSAGISKMAAKKMPPAFAGKIMFRPFKTELDIVKPAKYQPGQAVRVRNEHSRGHTRLPRYAKGKTGVIERDNGVFALPDSLTAGLGPRPQHLYLVSFSAQEIWGDEAPNNDKLYVSMWEDYLEQTVKVMNHG